MSGASLQVSSQTSPRYFRERPSSEIYFAAAQRGQCCLTASNDLADSYRFRQVSGSTWDLLFLLILVTINLFNFWQYNEGKIVSCYRFNFHYPFLQAEALYLLMWLLAFVFLFRELPIHIICPIFIVLCVFLKLICVRF